MTRTSRVSALLIMIACCLTLSAQEKCGADIVWELSDYGNLRLTGTGAMYDYSANDCPWVVENVTAIEIGEGVTSIGKYAFAHTRAVTVKLPSSLLTIGRCAFKGCKYLTSVSLPYGLQAIGEDAFAGCRVLAKANIPPTVRSIGAQAFDGCKALTALSVPSKVETIGKNAFANCKSLLEISELPDFITSANARFFGLDNSQMLAYEHAANEKSKAANVVAKSDVKKKETAKSPQAKTVAAAVVKYGESSVDQNVPRRPMNNSNTFVMAVANENYARLASVPFAINDGTSFINYCTTTLGVPDTNISFYKDATYGNINEGLAWLREIDDVYDGNINVIVYYAGHGVPDDSSNDAFLVPVDAAKPTRSVCMPMQEIYSQLGALKARSVKVFLDACFSGATRSNDMIAEGRGIALKPNKSQLKGNVVVISATSDDQTAWQYDSEGHGLFTYFLLKKLQETQGDVTMGELSDYLEDNVKKISTVVNRKRQTPSVNVSQSLGNKWRTWPVK